MSDYESMSVTELEQEIHRLDAERQGIRAQMKEAHTVLDRRLAEERARVMAASMSDPEKRALMQALQAEGVPSEEAVGIPGM